MNGKGVCERQKGKVGTALGRQRQRLRARPIVVALEDRWLLSTLVVNNPTDTPVADEIDLRQAIAEANELGGANTIAFDSDVFSSQQLITLTSGPLVLSGTGGTETILGPAAGLTVDGGGLSGVFQVNPGVTAAISGLSITGGNSPNGAGGGLFADGATLTLTNCYITGNSSGVNGGGIYSDGGTLSLAYCLVSGNSAPNGKGGGLASDNAAITLTDCVISGNTASQGGGMNAAGDDGVATLTNSTFSGNRAGSGSVAGLYFDGLAATLTDCDVTGNYGAGMALGDGVVATLSYCSVSGNYGVGLATGDGGTTTLKYCSVSTNLSSTAVGGLLIGKGDTATLTDCSISGNSAGGNGGGLFNNGTAALTYCSISGNTGIGEGGGLYNSGTATMTHCTVVGNTASGDGGGLVNVGGTATLNYCTLAGNSASGSGAGLANTSGSAALANCIVVGNSASDDGGGVYNLATTTLAECTVEGNTASDFGGGLWNSGAASTMTLTQCTVSGNTATLGAGGLGNVDGLSTVTESTVYGNYTGPSGSGGGSFTGPSGTTILINSTVTGNSAGVDGGGLYNGGLTRLTNCTISGNTAITGGGVFNSFLYAGSNVTLGNTIIAGNTAVIAGPDVAGAFDSLGNNLVGATDGSSGWISSDLVGTVADPDNAQLAPLGDNGGPTLTMALLAGSPAINSGNVALAVDAKGNTLTTDQRGAGFPRIVDGTVDIGAYEVQNPSETPTTTALSTSSSSSTYGQSVTLTATVSDSSGGVPTGSVEFYDGLTDLGTGTYVGGSGDSATWTYNTSSLPTTEQSLTAVYTPTELFSGSTSDNANVLVNPAPLTITADDASKTYGQAVTFTGTEFTTSGLVNGDSVTGVTLTSAGAAQTAGVNGSPYAVVPSSAVGSGLGNYIITYVDGNLTVNAAPLTITADNTSKTYGQTLMFSGTEFTTSGLLNGDTITSVDMSSVGTAATATVSSSPYAIVASNAVGSGVDNYTISYVNGSLTVNPAPLTITADNTSKTYGQTLAFAGTEFTTSGLFNDDSVTSVSLTSAGTAATATVAGSPYAIVPSDGAGSGLSNYTISYVDGNLTVNPAPLTIAAENASKTYGQTLTFTGTEFTTSGLVNSDAVTIVTLTSAGTAPTAEGAGSPYAIDPSDAVGSGLSNYTISYVDGNLTVNPAPLTITADDTSKTYGQTLAFAGTEFTTSGLLNSDTVTSVTLTSAGTAPTAEVAGSPYAIDPSDAAGSGLGNYTISFVDGNLTVNPAPLAITADNASKTYGQSISFAGTEFTTSGLFNDDSVTSVTLTSSGTAATATVAGSPYAVVPSNAAGSGLSNYSITYVDGSLTVNPAPLTITADNTSKIYGQTITIVDTEFTTSGLLNSDTVTSVSLSSAGTAATATVAGSPYAVVPSSAAGSGLGNYTITYVNGNLTVNPAPLTITADNVSKTYGQTEASTGAAFTASGLLNSDSVSSVSFSSSGSAPTATVAGSPYAIVPSNAAGSGLGNYTISYVDGSLTVNQAPLTITADNTSKIYGQSVTLVSTAFTTSGLVNSDTVTSVSLSSAGSAATATVGGSPYAIVPSNAAGSGLGNYTISYVDGSLTVNPAPLTITADNLSKTYGQTASLAGTMFNTNGLLNGNSVTSVTLTSAGASPTATVAGSPYVIVPSNAAGSGLGNYTITYVSGNLTINPAPLTITADNMSKTYGQTEASTGTAFTTSGLLNGDSVSSVSFSSAGSAPTATVAGSPYAIVPSSAVGSGLGNYTISYVDGCLTVNRAPLTITADNMSKTYGQTVTFTGTAFTSNGLVNSDSVTSVMLTSSGAASTATVAGSPYTIVPSNAVGSGLGNYTISYVNGSLIVNKAIATIATTPNTTTGVCGTSAVLTDTANLASAYDPTGTITFSLYSPSGTLLDSETVNVYGNGSYTPPRGYALPRSAAPGVYQWDSSYSGDSNHSAAYDNNNTNEQVTVNRASPTISTRPSTTSATCGSSVTLMDTATLCGGYGPTGTITFTLYSPSSALLDTETVRVNGDGTYNTPLGYKLPSNAAAGTYQWDAAYSGDADNNPATDNNDKAEQVVLSASVCNGQSGSLAYWCGSQGQSLINCLNGGSNCNSLGNWLAGNCPNLFGGLAHCTNSQVANYCNTLNDGNANQQACGQVLATAISCYVTNSSLAGYAGQSCGFSVTSNGTGAINYNVGGNGKSLGMSNNGSYSVLGLVQQIDRQSAYGAINPSALNAASSICGAINRAGASQNAALSDSGVVYTPAQIRAAYGISNLALDGSGQTIAIVDAYDDPDIFQSIDDFDTQFGLTSSGPTLYQQYGAASTFLTVLNQNGQTSSLPETDPSGSGTDNWEVEESLDVEWAHAIAPGAQIVLVEANSPSLSDLMSAVSTAAAEPGLSVVSMSWGFAEGQSVFASDEATYDSMFNVPGVAFVGSTGDYGGADPEYPAYSPNVLAVGGTSLTLNADGSYNSETGWGYQSQSAGAFIGSGGGISLYEPEPAYQAGVQSTGFRTTPDVSLDADPNTGAWIADAYNLDPSDPFEAVGGTSVAAPVWAGLLALVDQGSAAAGGLSLNSSAPTEVQQALYSLPQNDYNVISSGFNGYNAGPGYNLVSGLGTPIANLLVSDLVVYQSGTFTPSGPTVAPVQDANLVYTGTNDGGTTDAFAVFNSLIDTNAAFRSDRAALSASVASLSATLQPDGTESQAVVTRVAMSESSLGLLLPGAGQPGQLAQVLGTTTISNPSGQNPGFAVSITTAPVYASLAAPPAARSTAQASASAIAPVTYFDPARSPASDQGVLDEYRPSIAWTGRVYDAVLDELAGDMILPPAHRGSESIAIGGHATTQGALEPVPGDPRQQISLPSLQIDHVARLGVLGLAAGFWIRAREFREPRRRRAKRG
jgi:Bacterial Ig-like domain (group 3)/MBG domain (YGX type)/Right handed beta helix region